MSWQEVLGVEGRHPAKGVSRSYQVDNLPMTVLIDRSGTVRQVLRDYSAQSDQLYLRQLRALLNE